MDENIKAPIILQRHKIRIGVLGMKKLVKNIIISLIFIILACVSGQLDSNCSAESMSSRSKAILNSVVEHMKKIQKLPVMVDKETEWTSVSAGNGEFICHYTMLKAKAENMDKNKFIILMKKHLLSSGVCGKGNNRNAILQHGIAMRYIYYDKTGSLIGSFTITSKDCGFW